ncbi:MAG: argininosuccinate lyase [Cyclobacteriaceae bacterium]
MKLWDKGTSVNQLIEKFTIGMDWQLDLLLAPHDVIGSLAHIQMLLKIGIISPEEWEKLDKFLKNYYNEVSGGKFKIEEGVEDIHSQVELELTRELGEIGKKIHSGRSRNDQVLVDIRLYCRQQIQAIVDLSQSLFTSLLKLSEKNKDILLPGYTHFQVAMPSSFGLWFSAYAESLADDLQLMLAAFKVVNQNPLGSAAGYGTSFPLDRKMTTDLLGFEDLSYNVVYAQMGRGKTERTLAFAMAGLAATLSKFAYDICLYNSQNFGFISFPDELTTGSSIMPHKKNPDVFELIRGKCNKIQALPTEMTLISNNLPSGYHRDFQVLKESFFPAFENMKDCLQIMDFALGKAKVKENILADPRYRYIFSVEEVNKMVLQGESFRDAYKKIGQQIADGTYQEDHQVNHTHEGSIGNLCLPEISKKFEHVIRQFNFEQIEEKLNMLTR